MTISASTRHTINKSRASESIPRKRSMMVNGKRVVLWNMQFADIRKKQEAWIPHPTMLFVLSKPNHVT